MDETYFGARRSRGERGRGASGRTIVFGIFKRNGCVYTEIVPGDVARCPPRQRHRHGATTTTAMTHIAIAEALDGETVEWMEKVGDEQYLAASGAE